MRSFTTFLVLVVGFPSSASTQERFESLPQGQPVRVTSELLLDPVVGTFRGISEDSLWLVGESNQVVGLPLARVQRIEVRRIDRLTGALVGAGIGAVAFTIPFAVHGHSRGGFMDCGSCGFTDDLLFAALIGVPIGGLAGAGVGALIGKANWKAVQISPTLDRRESAGRTVGVRVRLRTPWEF